MARHGGARRRTLAPVVGALTLAALAAGGMSGAGLVGAGEQNADLAATEAEDGAWEYYSTPGAHHATTADARAAQTQGDLCADPSYYAVNAAECPAPREGTLAAMTAGGDSAQTGEWEAPIPGIGVNGTHTVVLPTGKLLLFSATRRAAGNTSTAYLYDPRTGAREAVPPPTDPATGLPYNVWCAGQTLLANGSVLVVGGNGAYPDSTTVPETGWRGIAEVFTFNPFDETWTQQPTMAKPRWYPTLTTLEDGRVLIYGGWVDSEPADPDADEYQRDIEVFTPSADPGGRGTLGAPITSTRDPGLYSPMTVLPSGDVLHAGPREPDMAVLEVASLATGTAKWNRLNRTTRRYWGAHAVRYEGPGRFTLVKVGGADPTSKATQRAISSIDLEQSGLPERLGPALATPRAHLNAVILPDGGLLAVGGGIGSGTDERGRTASLYADPVYQAELLAPGASEWRPAGSQQHPRTYHSTAVLLPDGRVLSAGDDRRGIGATDSDPIEIYRPPYLFGGARPVITGAPTAVPYGTSFRVATDQAASIRRAVLVAPGAVTHATDMNQRSVVLDLAPDGSRALSLTAPIDPGIAPPGYYMLFLVDERGTPSEGRFVRLGTASVVAPVPPPPPAHAVTPPAAVTPPVTPAPAPAPAPAGAKVADEVAPGPARTTARRPVAARGIGLRPTLRWRAHPRAIRYRVQVLRVSGGRARPVLSVVHTGLSLRVPARTLVPGGRYTWRVTALDGRRALGRVALRLPGSRFTVRP